MRITSKGNSHGALLDNVPIFFSAPNNNESARRLRESKRGAATQRAAHRQLWHVFVRQYSDRSANDLAQSRASLARTHKQSGVIDAQTI
jgi:hypothetical protein